MYYLLVEYALFICVIRLQHDDGDDDLRVCISFFLVAHQVCVYECKSQKQQLFIMQSLYCQINGIFCMSVQQQ